MANTVGLLRGIDYGISWKYIVDAMENKYGISPDNDERCPMDKFEKLLDKIFVDMMRERENRKTIPLKY